MSLSAPIPSRSTTRGLLAIVTFVWWSTWTAVVMAEESSPTAPGTDPQRMTTADLLQSRHQEHFHRHVALSSFPRSEFSSLMDSFCRPDPNGYFGATSGTSQPFLYWFELETLPTTNTRSVLRALSDAAFDAVLTDMFPSVCFSSTATATADDNESLLDSRDRRQRHRRTSLAQQQRRRRLKLQENQIQEDIVIKEARETHHLPELNKDLRDMEREKEKQILQVLKTHEEDQQGVVAEDVDEAQESQEQPQSQLQVHHPKQNHLQGASRLFAGGTDLERSADDQQAPQVSVQPQDRDKSAQTTAESSTENLAATQKVQELLLEGTKDKSRGTEDPTQDLEDPSQVDLDASSPTLVEEDEAIDEEVQSEKQDDSKMVKISGFRFSPDLVSAQEPCSNALDAEHNFCQRFASQVVVFGNNTELATPELEAIMIKAMQEEFDRLFEEQHHNDLDNPTLGVLRLEFFTGMNGSGGPSDSRGGGGSGGLAYNKLFEKIPLEVLMGLAGFITLLFLGIFVMIFCVKNRQHGNHRRRDHPLKQHARKPGFGGSHSETTQTQSMRYFSATGTHLDDRDFEDTQSAISSVCIDLQKGSVIPKIESYPSQPRVVVDFSQTNSSMGLSHSSSSGSNGVGLNNSHSSALSTTAAHGMPEDEEARQKAQPPLYLDEKGRLRDPWM